MVSGASTTDARLGRCWSSVPDPEIPVVSVVDLGIVRDVSRRTGSTITPTYTGCPATQVIERDIRAALDAAGFRDVRDRDHAVAALDHRLDQRERQGEARRLWHRPAERRRARGGLPAMRLGRHRGDQPLRLDAVQGAVALPRLPRAVRPVQVPLMSVVASTP